MQRSQLLSSYLFSMKTNDLHSTPTSPFGTALATYSHREIPLHAGLYKQAPYKQVQWDEVLYEKQIPNKLCSLNAGAG
jgi:hypothetical protein